jgi:hypothetical protein
VTQQVTPVTVQDLNRRELLSFISMIWSDSEAIAFAAESRRNVRQGAASLKTRLCYKSYFFATCEPALRE